MAVSKRLRYEILRRDNYRCRYCGASAPDVPLTVDHVTPVALGGTDEPTNLATSCDPCNSGKTSSTPDATLVANVSDDALRWAAAMKQAADNLLEQERPKDEYRDTFLAEWNRWNVGNDESKKVPLDDNWKQSIERFRIAGVPTWMWADIVDAGMANKKVTPENTFRYCCGIAWNKATALQEEARAILGESPPALHAAFDVESIDDLIAEAAELTWGQEWGVTFKSGPTREQGAKFKESVHKALAAGRKPAEILEAAEYAVWFGCGTAQEGLEHRDHQEEFIKQYVAHSLFTDAWYHVCAEMPSRKITDELWEDCEKLFQLGAHPTHVALAAATAGLHGTTRMYVGLSEEALKAIGVQPGLQCTEDLWAASWKNTSPDGLWPTEKERQSLRRSISRIGSAHRFLYSDVYAAAVQAGTYQDCDLSFHLTCRGSALDVAGVQLSEGGV